MVDVGVNQQHGCVEAGKSRTDPHSLVCWNVILGRPASNVRAGSSSVPYSVSEDTMPAP